MELGNLRTIDIASKLQISTSPVQKYLDGNRTLRRGYRQMLDRFVVEQERALTEGGPPKAAAG